MFLRIVGSHVHPESIAGGDDHTWRFAVWSLNLVALICLGSALVTPLVTIKTTMIFDNSVSIVGLIDLLWDDGEVVLAAIILAFSVLFPLSKLMAMQTAYAIVGRGCGRSMIPMIERLAKWSMAEVFIVAVIIVVLKSSLIAKASTAMGLYLFMTSFACAALTLWHTRRAALTQTQGSVTTIPNTLHGVRMAKKIPVSPLAPANPPKLEPIAGVRLATAKTGSCYKGRIDFLMSAFEPGTTAAGVFTRSRTASAPVEWSRRSLENGTARVLLVNAGNANAFTGKAGDAATRAVAKAAAGLFNCRQHDLFLASTGVIGEPLDPVPLTGALEDMAAKLSPRGWDRASRAIMTTDTFPKVSKRTAIIDGETVTINGLAKGSGMIAPDLATMLAFAFTDAAIPPDVLQTLLMVATKDTFNAITVDSDTSTSDTVMLFATGRGPQHGAVRRAEDPRLRDFREKLEDLMRDLAHQVVRDGEGATKFVTLRVNGAESATAARRIAMAIANSPLVKTAIAGEDPNWGRIVMAVGKAGEKTDRDRLKITMGGLPVARNGGVDPDFNEPSIAKHMKGQEIDIAVDVGIGRGAGVVWTCDLTHGYIDINADYRS